MRRAANNKASGSMHNLQELVDPGAADSTQSRLAALAAEEAEEVGEEEVKSAARVVLVTNSLPLKMRHDPEAGLTPLFSST